MSQLLSGIKDFAGGYMDPAGMKSFLQNQQFQQANPGQQLPAASPQSFAGGLGSFLGGIPMQANIGGVGLNMGQDVGQQQLLMRIMQQMQQRQRPQDPGTQRRTTPTVAPPNPFGSLGG